MDRLLEEFSSIYFWVGVVLVGILINIASTYIRKYIEYWLAGISSSLRQKREDRIAEDDRIIQALIESQDLRIIYQFREIKYRIRSLFFFVACLAFMAFAFYFNSFDEFILLTIVISIIALLAALFGMQDQQAAIRLSEFLHASVKDIDNIGM